MEVSFCRQRVPSQNREASYEYIYIESNAGSQRETSSETPFDLMDHVLKSLEIEGSSGSLNDYEIVQ